MKNRLLNKFSFYNRQSGQNEESFESLKKENERLENTNIKIQGEYDKIKNENEILKKSLDFFNFQEFLANSYVSPIVNAPFDATDKRVFAFMDHLSKYLIQNTSKSNEKSLISVIMYSFNSKDFIQNSIDSVVNQSYANWELIIVDDGSSDNTSNLLNGFADDRIKVLSHDETKGPSYSMNMALKEAKGDYVMYLASGNEWDSRYMETMLGAFMELVDAEAIYSGQLLYGDFNSFPSAVRFGSFNRSLLHNRNYIDLNCFCHKKEVYEKIGGFNEDLIQLADWDYILRISNEFKIYSVPVLLSKHYESNSLTKNYESNSLNPISDPQFDYHSLAEKILEDHPIPLKSYDALRYKVSVIIPNYEALAELKACIESILSFYSDDMVEIIVVDNNSGLETREYLKKMESKGMEIIFNDINFGFSYAVEQGIEISDANSDILILNNDALLTEGSIEHLQSGAYSLPNCGLTVPHEQVFEGNHHMHYNVPYADKSFKCDVTPSKQHHNIINMPVFHDGGLLELEFAPFFCTYIKREVYDKTLGLDPELGRHYRSDRIFSDFVRHILNMKIYQEPDAYVYHKHQAATKVLTKNEKEYDMMFKRNQWPEELSERLGYRKPLWD